MQAQIDVLWKPKLMDEHMPMDDIVKAWMEKLVLSTSYG
jgi:hypothetical protein